MQKCVLCGSKCNSWKYMCNDCENNQHSTAVIIEDNEYEDTELLVDIEILKNPSGRTKALIED